MRGYKSVVIERISNDYRDRYVKYVCLFLKKVDSF